MMIREPTGCAKIKMLRRSLCGFMVIIAQCYLVAVQSFPFLASDAPEPISTHDADADYRRRLLSSG